MGTNRLEAFSDAVLAIIITIMVLELHVPEEVTIEALVPLLPKFLAYALSFITLGIYWNNHHHLFHAAKHVNARIMWFNLFLLFWLSLVPFVTAWVGEHYMEVWPTAMYGLVHLASGFSFMLLVQSIVSVSGKDSALAKQLGKDIKGKLSLALYLLGTILAFFVPWLSYVVYALVAIMWFIPDKRLHLAKLLSDI